MRKIATKSQTQEDGSTLVESIIVSHSINHRMLDEKFGLREESFYDMENQTELSLTKPKIFRCDSVAVRKLTSAKKGEKVYVVRQIHREKFV